MKMKTKTKNKTAETAKKFIAEQKAIRAYLRGEITRKTLNERGIKLKMPL